MHHGWCVARYDPRGCTPKILHTYMATDMLRMISSLSLRPKLVRTCVSLLRISRQPERFGRYLLSKSLLLLLLLLAAPWFFALALSLSLALSGSLRALRASGAPPSPRRPERVASAARRAPPTRDALAGRPRLPPRLRRIHTRGAGRARSGVRPPPPPTSLRHGVVPRIPSPRPPPTTTLGGGVTSTSACPRPLLKPAASVTSASLPAASLPAASLPAASLPAASLPACKHRIVLRRVRRVGKPARAAQRTSSADELS